MNIVMSLDVSPTDFPKWLKQFSASSNVWKWSFTAPLPVISHFPPLSLNLVLLPLKCWYPITGWKFRKQFWDVRCLILFFSQRERRELVECIWFSCTLKDWEKDNTLLGWSVEESWYLYQISVCDIIWLSIFAITELHFAVLVWDKLVHRKTLYLYICFLKSKVTQETCNLVLYFPNNFT